MAKKLITVCFSLFFSLLAHAAVDCTDYPGAIPLNCNRPVASDLMYQGRAIMPDEATRLRANGTIPDLSQLNPREDSDLWRDTFPSTIASNLDDLAINTQIEEVEFIGTDASPIGRAGVLVSKADPARGPMRVFQVLVDPKGHDVLLRKTLLRKIGFNIPAIQRVQQLRIHFRGAFSKQEFVRDLQEQLFNRAGGFIASGADTQDEYLVLQDVLVMMGPTDRIYNLARGDMTPEIVQGRRLLNSLLVPFNLTDVPESVNRFSWVPGRIVNQNLVLPYADGEAFTPAREDAVWMTRRILRLTRADWAQVVQSAHYPAPVGTLVLEKLIARRNYLRTALGLQREFPDIPVNARISSGQDLRNGKLVRQTYAGYGPQFAGVDPENPLSPEEMQALVRSKAVSNVILNAVSQFNLNMLPRTDIGRAVFDRQLDLAVEQFLNFIRTGRVEKIPFGFFNIPYHSVDVIASREIVAGQYQGSDNMIQQADVVGLSLDTGMLFIGEGLPSQVTWDARASLNLVRTYTHLKPVTSIRAGLRQPFVNMVVPYLQHRQQHPLTEILKLEEQKDTMPADELEEQIKAQLDRFERDFGPGESFVIQTGIGPKLSTQIGYGFSQDASAYVRLSNTTTAIQRLHIYRKLGNEKAKIQFYNDPAFFNLAEFAMGVQAYIPVVELGWSWMTGNIRSNFFEISIDPDLEANPKFFDSIRALLSVIDTSRMGTLRAQAQPWVIEHDFSERQFRFDFLWHRYLSTNSYDNIRITHPQGASQGYVRKSMGRRTGRDWENLAVQVAGAVIDELNDSDVNVDIRSTTTGNPGDTFRGHSVTRSVTLESEVDRNGNNNVLDFNNLMINVNYRWKGWEAEALRAQRILDQISEQYGAEVFPNYSLAQTDRIQFYTIDTNLFLYRAAIEHIMQMPDSEIRTIFQRNLRRRMAQDRLDTVVRGFIRQRNRARDGLSRNDTNRVVSALLKMVFVAEGTLTFNGVKQWIGGENNLFLTGQINGFRVGDENGESPITSHTLGQIGSRHPQGPLATLQSHIGISSGELFAYWLLNRY